MINRGFNSPLILFWLIMRKLKKLIEECNLNEYQLTKNTGGYSRSDTLEKVLAGEREITSVNLNLLSAFARGLGVTLEDILESYELDGTSSQVISINRIVDKIRGVKEENREFRQDYDNGGFVVGTNIRRTTKEFPLLKTEYEFLNPDEDHEHQNTTEIYKLNKEYLNKPSNQFKTRNKTLTNIDPRFNSHALSFLVYTPLPTGGDLKAAVSVFDRNDNLMFSEVYGCEWISTDIQKDIAYYKYSSDKYITPLRIQNTKKEEISELEFYEGLYSQFQKFKIAK